LTAHKGIVTVYFGLDEDAWIDRRADLAIRRMRLVKEIPNSHWKLTISSRVVLSK
jgi:hypothetical protein